MEQHEVIEVYGTALSMIRTRATRITGTKVKDLGNIAIDALVRCNDYWLEKNELTVPKAFLEYQNAECGYKTKALYRLRAAVLAELKKAVAECKNME